MCYLHLCKTIINASSKSNSVHFFNFFINTSFLPRNARLFDSWIHSFDTKTISHHIVLSLILHSPNSFFMLQQVVSESYLKDLTICSRKDLIWRYFFTIDRDASVLVLFHIFGIELKWLPLLIIIIFIYCSSFGITSIFFNSFNSLFIWICFWTSMINIIID